MGCPGQASTGATQWELHASAAAIDIRNRLAELERRLESGADPERARVLRAALAAHEGELERLLDPREPGRGRALYLPLGGGEPAFFSNRLPLPNRVVLDDTAFVHPLLELIDEARPAGVVEDRRALAGMPQLELETEITRLLLADNREQQQRLLRSLRERAFGRGLAALALSEVLAALNQGRVAHLAYDPGVRFSGSVDDGGALRADGEAPVGPGQTEPEPRMNERIVERSLATGARVSPVEGASADALSEAGGIAALLRW